MTSQLVTSSHHDPQQLTPTDIGTAQYDCAGLSVSVPAHHFTTPILHLTGATASDLGLQEHVLTPTTPAELANLYSSDGGEEICEPLLLGAVVSPSSSSNLPTSFGLEPLSLTTSVISPILASVCQEQHHQRQQRQLHQEQGPPPTIDITSPGCQGQETILLEEVQETKNRTDAKVDGPAMIGVCDGSAMRSGVGIDSRNGAGGGSGVVVLAQRYSWVEPCGRPTSPPPEFNPRLHSHQVVEVSY